MTHVNRSEAGRARSREVTDIFSDWAERGFCSQCGTNLFYWYADGDQYIMCIGTFDDTTPFTMAGEIYIDSKPPGYAFAGDHPRQTEEEFLKSLGVA